MTDPNGVNYSQRDLMIGLHTKLDALGETSKKHNRVLFEGDEKMPAVVEVVRTVQSWGNSLSSLGRTLKAILVAVVAGGVLQYMQYVQTNDNIETAANATQAVAEKVEDATQFIKTKVDDLSPPPTVRVPADAPKAAPRKATKEKGWSRWLLP